MILVADCCLFVNEPLHSEVVAILLDVGDTALVVAVDKESIEDRALLLHQPNLAFLHTTPLM